MQQVFTSKKDLQTIFSPILTFSPLKIHDRTKLTEFGIDILVYNAVFAKKNIASICHQLISDIATIYQIRPSSIRSLYTAFGREDIKGFTVPAINIRTLTYDIARVIFRLMIAQKIGPVIFEIARSEIEYTHQRPQEYATVILAAAIKEGYQGPIFLQGDHYQFSKKHFEEDKYGEIQQLKDLIRESIEAKFFNIDIDASTLVDYTQKDLFQQQQLNSEMTATLTNYIHQVQPQNIDIATGGEIGHIGGRNSTPEDLIAFMKGYQEKVPTGGIIKVSVQTGTKHGGVILPNGTLQKVNLDFSVIKKISKIAREKYQLGGVVQHGASTLPLEYFDFFVQNETLEIHLATEWQNIVFDKMPDDLREKMYSYVWENFAQERQKEWTDEQFLYNVRKKALGPFKQVLWDLSDDEKAPILNTLSQTFSLIFEKLGIFNTQHIVQKYI
ncbi:MAG: aldolase [Patescibacteria group bacterium]|nr:MAG: aldolase [Patescibacteria group bacterium]